MASLKPSHTPPRSAPPPQALLGQVDELLLELGRDPSPAARLTLEHLAGVRTYLIDWMPEELALNLDLAEASLAGFPSPQLKARIQDFIKNVREKE